MITAIAIDDEPLALKIVEKFAAQSGQISLAKTFTQTHEAMQYLEQNRVDLIFLDINMPSISGIDFFRELKVQPKVIFTTAYSEYAVEGFNLNAVDYLLKPFTFARFQKALEKALFQLKMHTPDTAVVEPFLTVRADYSLIKIFLKDILLIESLDNYVKIHLLAQKPVLARMPLKTIADMLPKTSFVRIHRSYIVPVDKIKSIRNKTVFIEGHELPIGSSFERELMEFFEDRSSR
ncbi:MAG: LytTR family DNA-binding domain-containing protein [Chitinophagaceae bacterium]